MLRSLSPVIFSGETFVIATEFETKAAETFIFKVDPWTNHLEYSCPENLVFKSSEEGSWIYGWQNPVKIRSEAKDTS